MIKCLTMALPKTWCLLLLAALLPLSIVPTVAEVVKSMSDCKEFLLQQTPPRVPGILEGGNILKQNRYKPICQTFNNSRSFVTLYDTQNKIAVFSACKYKGYLLYRPTSIWKMEPQVGFLKTTFNSNIVSSGEYHIHSSRFRTTSKFLTCHIFHNSH